MSRSPKIPPISVVMPVHNALPFLDEAVESILRQTRADFEFVIYDDGSTDGSFERLQEWRLRDARIKLFRGARNLGPAASSNEVVRHASAELIARMDADDVSYADRLERQAEVFSRNPDVGIVASLCDVMDSRGRQIRGPEFWRLARKSWFTPFPHGSMMFRRTVYDAVGGYRDECEFWEDLDFVIRASEKCRILVFPAPLYRYRQSTSSTRIASDQSRVENALDLRYRSIAVVEQPSAYNELLKTGGGSTGRRIDPRVFLSLGLLSLWSEQRPSFVRRFLRRARLRLDAPTIMSLVWLSWARLSPGTMRLIMMQLSRVRNRAVGSIGTGDEPFEWRLPRNRDPSGGRELPARQAAPKESKRPRDPNQLRHS